MIRIKNILISKKRKIGRWYVFDGIKPIEFFFDKGGLCSFARTWGAQQN